jgi:lipopolysaccharide biosynthesis glycosyltransferase
MEPTHAIPGAVRRPYVLACDGAYAMQLATALRSLADSNPSGWPLDVHVLCYRFPEEVRSEVLASLPRGSATIRWIPVDVRRFRGLSPPSWISAMTCARLLIPEVLPGAASRAVCLDADVLVLDDLGPLWETSLGSAALGAVRDGLAAKIEAEAPGMRGIPRVRSYFNAGVLVVDVYRWRAERIAERALEWLSARPRTPLGDQDALNVACDGAWTPLEGRWNFQDHLETRIAELPPERRPAIVNFVTQEKPWRPRSLSVNAAFYDAIRDRTRFARTAREVVRDALEDAWWRSRRVLRRSPIARAVRDALVGPRDVSPSIPLPPGA